MLFRLCECDIIVCRINDWTDCPLEVIELRDLVTSGQLRTGGGRTWRFLDNGLDVSIPSFQHIRFRLVSWLGRPDDGFIGWVMSDPSCFIGATNRRASHNCGVIRDSHPAVVPVRVRSVFALRDAVRELSVRPAGLVLGRGVRHVRAVVWIDSSATRITRPNRNCPKERGGYG